MPILHDHYLIVPNKELHGIFDASAKKKTIAHNHAKSLADKTGKIIVVVRVVEIIVPEKAAEHHAHLTPESLASSQAVVNASALGQSDSVPPPAQAQVA